MHLRIKQALLVYILGSTFIKYSEEFVIVSILIKIIKVSGTKSVC